MVIEASESNRGKGRDNAAFARNRLHGNHIRARAGAVPSVLVLGRRRRQPLRGAEGTSMRTPVPQLFGRYSRESERSAALLSGAAVSAAHCYP